MKRTAAMTPSATILKPLLLLAALLPGVALAAAGHEKLDRAPIDTRDTASIQRGARTFVNYCLNCHSAQYMRYNRLTDLGLTPAEIERNLMFASMRIGDTMSVAMRPADARQWFGITPPDLSVVARARGADWLYTYLRSYYRDESTPTGWNNLIFPNLGMPHALWELQGQQILERKEQAGTHGQTHTVALVQSTPGSLSPRQYDATVADLVNYLVFMGEPARVKRVQIGYLVLIALGVLFVLTYLLKREYWKDVH